MQKALIVDETEDVVVTLKANQTGEVSLGIRINGSTDCLLSSSVTLPKPGKSQTYSTKVKDLKM